MKHGSAPLSEEQLKKALEDARIITAKLLSDEHLDDREKLVIALAEAFRIIDSAGLIVSPEKFARGLMNNPPFRAETADEKDQVIDRLRELWKASPQLRLMQLIGNAIPDDLYYIEDFRLVEELEIHYGIPRST